VHFNIAVDAGLGEDDSDIWSSLDEVTSGLFQDESYEGGQSSPTSLVAGTTDFMPLYDRDDSFSPLSSTSPGGQSSMSTPSASATQCQPEIPIPPDISPLLRSCHVPTNEQMASRVPTPPDITPLLKGALSSANIQLPVVSAQPSLVSMLLKFIGVGTCDCWTVLVKYHCFWVVFLCSMHCLIMNDIQPS